MRVRSLGGKDPLEKGMATHSSILVWRIPMDRGAWQAIVHGVVKSRTRLSDLAHTCPYNIRKPRKTVGLLSHVPSPEGMPASLFKNSCVYLFISGCAGSWLLLPGLL